MQGGNSAHYPAPVPPLTRAAAEGASSERAEPFPASKLDCLQR